MPQSVLDATVVRKTDLQHSLSQSNGGGRQWTSKTNILHHERSYKYDGGNEEGNESRLGGSVG